MNDSRGKILGRIRAATSSLPNPAQRPQYDPSLPTSRAGAKALQAADRIAVFRAQWEAVSGRWAADWKDLQSLWNGQTGGPLDVAGADHPGYCAPEFEEALKAACPEAPIVTAFDRSRVDDYPFAITPAWGAIAETGTVILTDQLTPARLAALAPWAHVAVIPPDRIFATVAAAMAELPDDPSIVLVTGPSKTADIEGILIEGVHGPGIQVALVHPA
ncbi:MAG: LutC/YkgG family protein [Oceanipulchritudo sp.]